MTRTAPITPTPEIVLRHVEPEEDLAFAKALEVVERLAASPGRWELRRDSTWHNGDHRIFRASHEVSIQPKEGSALVVVDMAKGAWTGPVEATRHILDAMRMVRGRRSDDDQDQFAHRWCIAAFSTMSDTGHLPKRVSMATPWESASWEPKGRGDHSPRIRRMLDACPTALRWEAHMDDGLPHVRIDAVEWTLWNQQDLNPDAMEILRAFRSVEERIDAMVARTES